MTSESHLDTPYWYILNYIGGNLQKSAQKSVDRFNTWHKNNLELFAPTYVVKEERDGEIRFKTANLTFHYVFVKGTHADVKRLCSQSNGFSFLIDRGSAERYAIISDREMAHFKNIARAYKNCLPYFPLDEIDLEDGDLVEVIKGDFPGLIGSFMPKAKSKNGDIVLNVYNNMGVIAFNVKATDIRILEFSRNSTRANDQIDAFVPHLLSALRYFHRNEALPTTLIAKLSVFCSRMEVVSLNNRKLDARLRILLYAANYILGNTPESEKAKAQYDKLKGAITNEWTNALCNLILSVIDNNKTIIAANYEKFKTLSPSSKTQKMIMDEYEYYNTN